MNLQKIIEFQNFIKNDCNNISDKNIVRDKSIQIFNLNKDRTTYYNNEFAVVFSFTSNINHYSNVIISLNKIKKYDNIPFFNAVITNNENHLFLINSSFIKKISHSSKNLSLTHICGSILGTDIIKTENIEDYNEHLQNTWENNFIRIYNNTKNIVPKYSKKIFDKNEINNIFQSIDYAENFYKNSYFTIQSQLDEQLKFINNNYNTILSKIKNKDSNTRGKIIQEIFITQSLDPLFNTFYSSNGLDDYKIDNYYIDIKTHFEGNPSNPKLYNIDKLLSFYSNNPSKIFCIYIICLNDKCATGLLYSVYDENILNNILITNAWSGINSRGTTQIKINNIINNKIKNINTEQAKLFLEEII